ncbi:MAG: HEAT repeat domain-containing protein, partial [Deltaproteobacteria bacterium]|nr:HEAT repeat domain-containing protein [Deltaproteobacteria bacterium]
IRLAGQQVEGIDLAEFIADLRAEVLSLRGGVPRLDGQPRTGFATTEQAATTLEAAGRIGITDADRSALEAAARFDTRSEETLFALSLRELSASDPMARVRAAQRLQALSARAALPAVAAALNAEQSAEVLCALLQVCGAAGEASILPLIQARLVHDEVEVRLAALEAAVKLHDPTCLSHALDDACARVRRRAAILASGDRDTSGVLQRAIHDTDPSVRRAAVLGFASLGGTCAEGGLLDALDDDDPTVRRAAAKGLSRSLGPDVFAIADLDPARRRREIRRLSTLPGAERSSSLAAVLGEPLPATIPAVAPPPPAPRPAAEPPAALQAEVLSRIYAALRGQSDDELVRGMPGQPALVLEAAAALVGKGRLVRRGQRYFVP